MFKRSNYFYKLFTSYVCIICCVVAIIGFIAHHLISSNMFNERNRENKSIVNKMTETYRGVLQDVEKISYLIAIDENINRYLLYEKDTYNFYSNLIDVSILLRDYVTNNDLIHSIYVYSNINEHIVSNEYSTNTPIFYDLQWKKFYDISTNTSVWLKSRTLFNMANNGNSPRGEDVITLIKKIYSGRMRTGAVIINVSQKELQKQILKYIPEGLVESLIVNIDNEIITSFHRTENITLINRELMELVQDAKPGECITFDGGLIQVFKSNLTDEWTNISIINYSSYYKAKASLTNTIVIICIIVTLSAVIGSFYISRANFKTLGRFLAGISSSLKSKVSFEYENISDFDFKTIEKMFKMFYEKFTRMEVEIKQRNSIIKERYLKSLLLNESTQIVLEEYQLDDWQKNNNYVYVILNIFVSELKSGFDKELQYFRLFEIKKKVINSFLEVNNCEPVEMDLNNIAVVFRMPKNTVDEYKNNVQDLLKKFIGGVEKLNAKYKVSIGVGLVYTTFNRIHYSYREALEAVQYKIFSETENIIFYEDINNQEEYDREKLKQLKRDFYDDLITVEYDKVKARISDIISILKESKVSLETVENTFTDILLNCMNVIQCNMLSIDSVLGADFSITRKFSEFNSFNEMEKFLQTVTLNLIEQINSVRNIQMSSVLVEKCKMIIQEEFSSYDLSLNYIADKLNVSSSHLSRCFKSETGENLSEYIINLRIKKACKLILNTNMKITQIVEEVGYTNAVSFNRVFKKVTNITPGELRKQGIISDIRG